jgi:hypothetical protein
VRKKVGILTSFRKWEKEAWGGVNGKDTETKFVECKFRRRVKKKGWNFDIIERIKERDFDKLEREKKK